MTDERFNELKASVVEAGMIMRGEMPPGREFFVEKLDHAGPPIDTWAICLESDDPSLLVPRKLYLVKYGESGVLVRDENGENVFCDKEDFLPLSLGVRVEEILALAA